MTALSQRLRSSLNTTLRAVAAELRQRDPKLYQRLRDVRRSWVVGSGSPLATYQHLSLQWFQAHVDFRDRVVVELGGDRHQLVADAILAAGARRVTSVNRDADLFTDGPERQSRHGARLMQGDVTALPFDDASVDVVVSVAVFEHLLDFPRALDEAWRVLRPGGLQLAFFGPIWSGGRGHHVSVEVDGTAYRHFLPDRNPIPDHGHLLLDEEALREGLRHQGLPERAVEAIGHYVYRGDAINRLFLDDYRTMVDASGFTPLAWRYDRDPVSPAVAALLALRHPPHRDFDVTNAYVAMTKDTA